MDRSELAPGSDQDQTENTRPPISRRGLLGTLAGAAGGAVLAGPAQARGRDVDAAAFDSLYARRALGPATMPWLLAASSFPTEDGVLYGGLIYPETSSVHRRVQFVTGSTPPLGVKACCVVIWGRRGKVLAQSRDCAKHVKAPNALVTAKFPKPVHLTRGTPVFAAIGYHGGTSPGLRGVDLGLPELADRALPNAGRALGGRSAEHWKGGPAPRGGKPRSLIPYIEFV